jgi:hypothetical protein
MHTALGRGHRKNRGVQSRPAKTLCPVCGAVKFGNIIIFINVSIFSNFASILWRIFPQERKKLTSSDFCSNKHSVVIPNCS